MKFSQSSFAGGELSPLMLGRTDWPRYRSGLSLCQNMVATPQGALMRRPGTQYAGAAKVVSGHSTKRLEPFIGSDNTVYIVEMGHLYFRFWTGGALVQIAGVPVEVVTPYRDVDLWQVQYAQINDVMYLAHSLYPPQKLTRTAADAFSILNMMDHSALPDSFLFWDGPYLEENSSIENMTPFAGDPVNANETCRLTVSSASAVNGGLGFTPLDIGRIIRFNNPKDGGGNDVSYLTPNWGWGVITAVPTPPLTVSVYVMRSFATANTGANPCSSTRWALGAWAKSEVTGWTGSLIGYPSAVTIFQQRVVFGFSPYRPQGIWASVSGDLEDFQPTGSPVGRNVLYRAGPPIVGPTDETPDDAALVLQPALEHTVLGRWFATQQALFVGHNTGVYEVSAGNNSNAVTPSSASITDIASFAAQPDVAPVRVGRALLYVQDHGRKLREMLFDLLSNTFGAQDLSLQAEHLTASGIKKIVYADQPNSIAWMLRTDQSLVGMTYDLQQQILGWHRHVLGGLPINIEAITQIPVPGQYNQLWLCVNRQINGATVQYMEYLTPYWSLAESTQEQAWYLDCAKQTVSGSPITVISGLDHLEGETVQVYADGAMQDDNVVTGGAITLKTAAKTILVGYNISGLAVTLPVHRFDGRDDQLLGALSKLNKVTVRVAETAGYQIGPGPDATRMWPITFREGNTLPDAPPPLFTGDNGPLDRNPEALGGESHFQSVLYLGTLDALPLTVLALGIDFTAGEP